MRDPRLKRIHALLLDLHHLSHAFNLIACQLQSNLEAVSKGLVLILKSYVEIFQCEIMKHTIAKNALSSVITHLNHKFMTGVSPIAIHHWLQLVMRDCREVLKSAKPVGDQRGAMQKQTLEYLRDLWSIKGPIHHAFTRDMTHGQWLQHVATSLKPLTLPIFLPSLSTLIGSGVRISRQTIKTTPFTAPHVPLLDADLKIKNLKALNHETYECVSNIAAWLHKFKCKPYGRGTPIFDKLEGPPALNAHIMMIQIMGCDAKWKPNLQIKQTPFELGLVFQCCFGSQADPEKIIATQGQKNIWNPMNAKTLKKLITWHNAMSESLRSQKGIIVQKIVFEGPIGGGKTTLLRRVSERLRNTITFSEPLDFWAKIGLFDMWQQCRIWVFDQMFHEGLKRAGHGSCNVSMAMGHSHNAIQSVTNNYLRQFLTESFRQQCMWLSIAMTGMGHILTQLAIMKHLFTTRGQHEMQYTLIKQRDAFSSNASFGPFLYGMCPMHDAMQRMIHAWPMMRQKLSKKVEIIQNAYVAGQVGDNTASVQQMSDETPSIPIHQFDCHAILAAEYLKPFLNFSIADHYLYLNVPISTCANRLASRHQSDFYTTRQGLVRYETDWHFAILIQKIWQNPRFRAMVHSKVLKKGSKISIVNMPFGLQASTNKICQMISLWTDGNAPTLDNK